MFTHARICNGTTYLGDHLSCSDYYAEGEKVTGYWIGQGAELLGLNGNGEAEQFEALRTSRVPGTDERLTPRTKYMRMPSLRKAQKAFRVEHGRKWTSLEVENFRITNCGVIGRDSGVISDIRITDLADER